MVLAAGSRLETLLEVHSFFSFGQGTSSPTRLVQRATELGYRYLALTDQAGIYGAAELALAGQKYGLRPLLGASLAFEWQKNSYSLILLAANSQGYQNLCSLITLAHQGPLNLERDPEHYEGIFLLTGPRWGFPSQLLARRQISQLGHIMDRLEAAFPGRVFIQLFHDRYPGDNRRAKVLRSWAQERRLPAVAAPEVRYLSPELFPLYDALFLARAGRTVADFFPERPRNSAQYLLAPAEAMARIPFPETWANANALASEIAFDWLPGQILLPRLYPDSQSLLESRVYQMLPQVYSHPASARERLASELATIKSLGLADFFLAAAEVCDYCRAHGILAWGRGSAAASVVCYLLGITQADPIAHGFLFERFLHTGKATMPDIDIDIASSRREEVLAWAETRFGDIEAMAARRVTYRLPLAVQDLGRALGIPAPLRVELTRALGRDYRYLRPHRAREAAPIFAEVLGDSPASRVLISLLEKMEPGTVRGIAPHNGGVILAPGELWRYSPWQTSTGGVRIVQFDKDDLESLGLVKLDLLGLRMLSALERAREEVYRNYGIWLELAALPEEPAVWRALGRGDTMGIFQVESPGQVRTSVALKPQNLTELAHQIALFRPGPVQSGTVHPYLRRRQGKEPVSFPHPALAPILAPTYGVILFQEQVLRIATSFAGLDWEAADRLRKMLSGGRDGEELKASFIQGAMRYSQASLAQAEEVYAKLAAFQGYGFAESHAMAFALHAYASAWLKLHYPAAYLAGLLEEAPGMWPLATLRAEAGRSGVKLLPLDINSSGVHYQSCGNTLRIPLSAVRGISLESAREVVLARLAGPFAGPEELWRRTPLKKDAVMALARAGAFDSLMPRREAIFRAGALQSRGSLFDWIPNPPPLAELSEAEKFALDFQTQGLSASSLHPMDLLRGAA